MLTLPIDPEIHALDKIVERQVARQPAGNGRFFSL